MSSYTVEAVLKAKDSGFSSAFKAAERSVSGLSNMASKVGSTFKSVLGANLISSALTQGISTITGGLREMAGELNSSQKAWKTFEGNLQAFGRSADEIKAAKTEMQDFATKTIYSASDMASTYSQLDAVGTKNVGSLVKAFGGLAASAENPAQAMKSLSTQATQMASKPKVAWMDFKIMMEQAPAGMSAVAKEMGMSTAELVSAVQDGKISTEAFFDAMNKAGNSDAFQKMATEFKTIDQAIDGAKESLSNKLMPAFEHLNKFGIKAVNALSDALEKINFDKMAEGLGKFLESVNIEGIVSNVSSAFAKIGGLVKSFFATVGDTGVFQNLSDTFSLFGELASSVFDTLVGDAALFGDVAESIGDVFNIVLFTIQDLISGAQSLFTSFANTGAIKAVSAAFYDLVKAGLDLSEKLSGVIPWESIGTAAGQVVKFIAQIVQAIANFSQSLSGNAWRGIITGVGGALIAFKGFNFLKSFNPFNFFKKNADEALNGATNGAKRSKGTISQIFNGLSNVVKNLGTALKSTFQGIGAMFTGLGKTFEGFGKGLGAALKGLMQGLRGLNPATLLSFGASVGIAAIGIGAGIAIISAGFALLATQSQGISEILQAIGSVVVSVGTALSTILNQAIQGLAQALVIVAPVLPTITSAFARLSPLIIAAGLAISMIIRAFSSLAPVITALGTAISEIVTAITTGVADIATAVTPMVEILSSAFVQVVTVVSQAIVEIIQALAPFIPAITEMVVAVAPVLDSLVQAFTTLIEQVSPIIDSLTELLETFGEQVRSILESAGGVVESFGSAIRNVLDGVAGIFESMGNAALNAGKGVKQMAQGIKILVDLKLGDLIGTLTAVATGLTAIAASGIATAGPGLQQAGTGLMLIARSAQMASVAMQALPTALSSLGTSIGTLPSALTTAGTAITAFASAAMISFANLSGSTVRITVLQGILTRLATSMLLARSSAFQLGAALPMVASGFTSISIAATSAMSQLNSAVRSTMTHAVSIMRSSMQQMVSVVRQSASQMTQAGRQAGKGVSDGVTNGIRAGIGQVGGAMHAMVNAVRDTGMEGVGKMRYVGSMIGQGLAQGMYSALGSVTAAANALVAQAERAARAKAQIHSPARLFRDRVGIFIGQGVAVGIDKSTKYVNKAMDSMFDGIDRFNMQVSDMMGENLAYSFDTGNSSSSVEVTYRRQDTEEMGVIKEALSTIKELVGRDFVFNVNGQEFARATGDDMTAYQNDRQQVENLLRGIR